MRNEEKSSLDYRLKPLSEIIGKELHRKKGQVYMFNEDGIIVCKPHEEGERRIINTITLIDDNFSNEEALKHALSKIEVGWTYDMLVKQLKKSQAHYKKIRELHSKGEKLHPDPVGIGRFLVHYERPVFERIPENKNTSTFDFVKVSVGYATIWPFGDRKAYIKENIREITDRVVRHLEEYKQFAKYEVPVNMLTVTKVLDRMDSTLEFIFELKKELRGEQKEE